MSGDLTERLAGLACEGLRELADDFAEAVGRKPTPVELCDLIAYGVQSSREQLFDDVPTNAAVTALRPKLRGGDGNGDGDGNSSPSTAVEELDDNVFSQANGLVTDLGRAYHGETGERPKLQALCDVLVEALHRCGADVISGAQPEDIVGIEPELREAAGGSARPGDIVAIPAPGGDYFTAVVVTRNQAGTAYGVFRGTRGAEPVSASDRPEVIPHPIYSGDELVNDGSWPIVGHDEGLLELFPEEPEVFRGAPLMPDVEPEAGEFGSAETPSGQRRDLTEEEAEEIGLTDGTYSEFQPPEVVPEYLAQRQGRR